MTDELFLPLSIWTDPAWWPNLVKMHANSELSVNLAEFVLGRFNATMTLDQERLIYTGIKFKNKSDMIYFMLKCS